MNYIYNFYPEEFNYLIKTKKIEYLNINLKTDYIINIMHDLIIKYFFTKETIFNLWSIILKQRYGKYYNYYIKYLIDKKFIKILSNYYAGKKSKTYELNKEYLKNIKKYKLTDKILLNKHKKIGFFNNITSLNNNVIDIKLKKKLINNLYHIKIDYEKALKYIKIFKDEEPDKYYKNYITIESIKNNNIFFKFDSYGRFHTNFTILKKYIRNNFLTIDELEIEEIDIKNSQPLFFTIILKNEIKEKNFNNEVKDFIDIVKNGLLYDKFLNQYPNIIETRKDAKILVYKVLFGTNNSKNKANKIFKELYPTVFEYIKELKNKSGDYKDLSHRLQILESKFIFNKVIKTINNKFPNIRLFTIHDSIMFPKKYKNEVELVFNYYMKELLN